MDEDDRIVWDKVGKMEDYRRCLHKVWPKKKY
jgi:hypothetical protein